MIAIFPEIAASATAGDVDQLAILVRRYFGGKQTYAPRPDVSTFVEGAGVTLRYLGLATEGALLAKDERGVFNIVMVVNQNVEQLAARFLIAHLLGHYLLDVQPLIARGEMQISGYQEPLSPMARYGNGGNGPLPGAMDREERADAFAAGLLMPRGMLARAVGKLRDPNKVAHFFGVSRSCLHRRLIALGMVPNDPVNFLDAEMRIGETPAAARDVPPPQLSPVGGAMPRAYAASSYGATEKATRQPNPPADAAPVRESPAASPEAGPVAPLRGMDRLRELARKLDKGLPPSR